VKYLRLVLTLLALLYFAGCARVSSEWTSIQNNNQQNINTDVPFFAQEKYQCGPAVMAMLLGETGTQVTQEELIPIIYTPTKKGSLQSAMIAGARRYGKIPYVFYGPETLISELGNDRPAGVLLNLGLSFAPRWHYAVVTGADFKNDKIIMHSGLEKDKRMKLATFDHTWNRANYWGLYVLNPEDIPESAEPVRYVETVSAFEKMGRYDIALTAYKAAFEKWQNNLFVMLGLSNTYYALNDLENAESVLEKAVELHPESGEALNNYAYVLYKNGKKDKAIIYAEKALETSGGDPAVYQSTLDEIKSAM